MYAAGLDASRLEKAQILPYLVGPTILELGCGNGTVLSLIAEDFKGKDLELHGVDFSSDLLYRASLRDYENAHVRLTCADLIGKDTDPSPVTDNYFNSVVMSSFLHEVYSAVLTTPSIVPRVVGPRDGDACGYLAVSDMVGVARAALTDFGRLVIRDGVKPEEQQLRVCFKTNTARHAFFRFAADFRPRRITFTIHREGAAESFHISAPDFYEFATKYIYLERNWQVEMNEQFGFATENELQKMLGQHGFSVLTSKPHTVPYLANQWANDFDVTLADSPSEPYTALHSTILLVATKLPRRGG